MQPGCRTAMPDLPPTPAPEKPLPRSAVLRDALEQPSEHQAGTFAGSGRIGTHSSPNISGSA